MGDARIGSQDDSISIATVDGPNSTWTNSGSMIVAAEGTATLDITGGGRVANTDAFIASDAGGTGIVTVDGANSMWMNSGGLKVGTIGTATLNITAGGRVFSADARIASDSDSTGTVTVTGAGSSWAIDGPLLVGGNSTNNGGTGTLRIQPGGTVDVAQETTLFLNDQLILEGGTLSASRISFFQGGGTFQWTSGTLSVGIYHGNLQVPNSGVLDAGILNGFGSTNIIGGYNQQAAGATLEFEFGGGGLQEAVFVTDTAVLGGNLKLTLLDGAVPSAAINFIIFDALSIFGAFTNVANGQRLTTSDGLGSFLVHYGAGSAFDPSEIVLSNFLPGAVPGDYNQDGRVNAADYTVWRNNLGRSTALPNDDTPGVAADDYARWKTHFGETAGSGAGGVAAVPESATLVLLSLAAIGLLRFRVTIFSTPAIPSRHSLAGA